MPAAENPTVALVEAAYRHHGLDWRDINGEIGAEIGQQGERCETLGTLDRSVRQPPV